MLYIEGRRFWTNMLDVQDGLLSLRSVHALESRFCFTSAKKTIAMDCTQQPDVSVHLSRDNLQMANRRPLLVVWPKKSSPHVMPQCLSCTPPITTSVFLSFSSLRFWSWLHLPPSSRLAPPPLPHQDGTFRSQFLFYGMQTISAPGRYIVVYLKSPLSLFTFFSLSVFVVLRHYLPLKWYLAIGKVKNAIFFCFFGLAKRKEGQFSAPLPSLSFLVSLVLVSKNKADQKEERQKKNSTSRGFWEIVCE